MGKKQQQQQQQTKKEGKFKVDNANPRRYLSENVPLWYMQRKKMKTA